MSFPTSPLGEVITQPGRLPGTEQVTGIRCFDRLISVHNEVLNNTQLTAYLARRALGYKLSELEGQYDYTKAQLEHDRLETERQLKARNLPHAVRRAFETGIFQTAQPLEGLVRFRETERIALHGASLGECRLATALRLGLSEKSIENYRQNAAARIGLPYVPAASLVFYGLISGNLKYDLDVQPTLGNLSFHVLQAAENSLSVTA